VHTGSAWQAVRVFRSPEFLWHHERMPLRSLCATLAIACPLFAGDVQTVHFQSADQKTMLVGYLFPAAGHGPHPAIVMLHGRAGPYSSLAHGVYDATTLSKRHKEYGEFWSERGYVTLLVDSFGPRGYPQGFPRGSYEDRPPEVSEQTVRPLDAYEALRYLRTRSDVAADRVGVQGWSNGGMTVLVTMSDKGASPDGFRAALAEYPGCGMEAVEGHYHPYAPLLLMIAAEDEEVSPKICEAFAKRAEPGGNIETVVFEGAEHNFDDPGQKKQSNPANHKATEEAKEMAERFFAKQLGTSR
jgi:dienelactone hydrolase